MNIFNDDRFLLKALINKEPWILKEIAVYEGLISTTSLQQSFMILSRKYNVKPNYNDNTFRIILDGTESSKFIEELLVKTNNLGWFPSYFSSPYGGGKWAEKEITRLTDKGIPFAVGFEAKFDIELYKDKIPKKLYHITPTKNIEKIKKIGLTPRSGSKIASHPERIYFADSVSNTKQLLGAMKQSDPKNINYSLIDIDSTDLPITTRFFKDPNFIGGVYTLSNIAPIFLNISEI